MMMQTSGGDGMDVTKIDPLVDYDPWQETVMERAERNRMAARSAAGGSALIFGGAPHSPLRP